MSAGLEQHMMKEIRCQAQAFTRKRDTTDLL